MFANAFIATVQNGLATYMDIHWSVKSVDMHTSARNTHLLMGLDYKSRKDPMCMTKFEFVYFIGVGNFHQQITIISSCHDVRGSSKRLKLTHVMYTV